MNANAAALLVLSTAIFAALYFQAVTRFSRSLGSPYAKANVRRRFAAAAIDGLLFTACLGLSVSFQSVSFLVAAAAYLLLRDAVAGQSIGKFLFSLIVIRLHTGRPCNVWSSARRNAILIIPGANVVAIVLEALTITRDPRGQRLGDRIARTQVVDGLGARELLKHIQLGLLDIDGIRTATKTERKPVKV